MKLTRSSLKKPQTEFEARKNEESISLPLFPCLRKTRDQERKYIYIKWEDGSKMRATFRRCFPPLPSSRVFLAPGCIHRSDVFKGSGFGVFALRVMDERVRSRWAWWSRSQRTVTHRAHAVHARARERESMTHVLYTRARTGRNGACVSFFPIVLSLLVRRTFVT